MIQMSLRRECKLKMLRRLYSKLQGWYTPNGFVNYIQFLPKVYTGLLEGFHQVQAILLHQTKLKGKAKLLVHQLSQPTPPPPID